MTVDIGRAWKDAEYRKTLTPEELATLPPNPAGDSALKADELEKISGGISWPETLEAKCATPVVICSLPTTEAGCKSTLSGCVLPI
jgi:mersacidin/lichenicidin family type 2 lantibiotic